MNLSARSRLSGQLEIKHSFLPHLVLTLKLKKYELFGRLSSKSRSDCQHLAIVISTSLHKAPIDPLFQPSNQSLLL